MSDNLKGAALTSLVVLLYTLNDGLMKLIISQMPLSQAVFFRNLAILPLMGLLAWHLKAHKWKLSRKAWGISVLRGLNEVLLTICLLLAFRYMLLSDAIAILQAAPLLLTAVAALFFAEKVSPARWATVIVGLLGVLIIIRPGTEAFDWSSLYAVAAVCFLTIRDSLSKSLPKGTPDLLPALIATFIVFSSSPFYEFGTPWVSLNTQLIGLLATASIFMFGATYFSISMMRIGDVSFTQPFRYLAILWSALIGMIFFDEWPDATMWIGALILVGSGIYLIRNK